MVFEFATFKSCCTFSSTIALGVAVVMIEIIDYLGRQSDIEFELSLRLDLVSND